ncbi:MAG: hypothetical protein ABSB83_04625 [Methanomassiliicoccales archaeon]|jgi:hypothetical protein
MKILIFTEGTILTHKNWVELEREEVVRRIRDGINLDLAYFTASVPIGNSVGKIRKWAGQGAEIVYLTSRRKQEEIAAIQSVLETFGFPQGKLLFRIGSESYGEVASRERPDVLVEDDCESIGGESEMTYPHLSPAVRPRVKSIVVKEFLGIDGLPESISDLLRY